MTTEEHKQRHIELHKAFDELMADYLAHNKDSMLSTTTLMQLMQWSHQQTISPLDARESRYIHE